MTRSRRWWVALVLVSVWIAGLGQASAQRATLSLEELGPVELRAEVLERVLQSTVRAYWRGVEEDAVTYGFCVGDGIFISVRKEATLAEEVQMELREKRWNARVTLLDTASGLVVLKARNPRNVSVPALTLASARQFFVGDPIFALRVNALTTLPEQSRAALVIGRDRRVNGQTLPLSLLRVQTQQMITHPGLPLLDHLGRVVAVDLGADLDDDGEEYHVLPADVVSKLVTDLAEFGRREDAWLGLSFNTGTSTAKVVAVRPGSPGDEAGMKAGDVVIYLAGARIDTLDDLADSCYCLTPGRTASIHVLRGIDRIERELTPLTAASKPASAPPEGGAQKP